MPLTFFVGKLPVIPKVYNLYVTFGIPPGIISFVIILFIILEGLS